MSGKDVPPRVQWPYKHLWNLLRGESILADDEVILEELRLSYEPITQALTQFKPRNSDASSSSSTELGDSTKSKSGTTDEASSSSKKPESSKDEHADKKLRTRISEYLDLDEKIAWELFCSYMMFEYRGGSTSFDKLLEISRVTNDFLGDLKSYYMQERTSVLLCIQALFGNLDDSTHKYYHIFRSFSNWADENGMSIITENLLESLQCTQNESEEVEVLHALVLLTFQVPHLSIKPFCMGFKGFKPGKKSERLLEAEAALMYTTLLIPAFDLDDRPEEIMQCLNDLLIKHAEDLLLNKFAVGAVLGGYTVSCEGNQTVRNVLTTCPHPSASCVPNMTLLARCYSKDSIVNRHNLSTAVLTGLYDAITAIYDGFETAIPAFGVKEAYFQLLIAVLRNNAITLKFLCTKPEIMDLYIDAMLLFPLRLQWMLGIWGTVCAAGTSSEESSSMLESVLALLTTVSEYSSDPIFSYARYDPSLSYRNPRERMVAGLMVPVGLEAVSVSPIDNSDVFIVSWDLKSIAPLNAWQIIFTEVLMPVINRLKDGVRGSILQDEDSELWSETEQENISAVIKFLIDFASVSNSISPELHALYEPMAFIMLRSVDLVRDMREKALFASDMIKLIAAANVFGYQPWTLQYLSTVWPSPSESSSLVEDIIMGYESVASNDCKVTLAFLKSVLAFFKEDEDVITVASPTLQMVAYSSVSFINDNVFHSYTRWRMESDEVKFKVLLNCLKTYNSVFSITDPDWAEVKNNCSKSLLSPNSSLMAALNTDDEILQLSLLKPRRSVYLIPEVIYQSLSLLLKLFQYQKESIKMVDTSLGLTLVQKLGRFARHRMDYKIPTLAMSLLRKIAEELNMSLLSCFGSDEVAFRDLILQRLEFRSEDVNLKVAILEFLTVAAHTQPGLIQYVFMDEVLAEKIVDLPVERDEGLSLSVLLFLRALFRKGATVMKKCKHLWEHIFIPIKLLQFGGRVRIITCTLNISSLELYHCGLSDPAFVTELKSLLKTEEIVRLLEIALAERGELAVKCLLAIKHFITVVLSRNDLTESFPEDTRKELLDLITTKFWKDKENEIASDSRLTTSMVELMCILAASLGEYPDYLNELAGKLTKHFFEDCVSVQVALLSLTNERLKKVSAPLLPEVVENIVRVLCRIFANARIVFQSQDVSSVHPLLIMSAAIVCTIIKSDYCSEWVKIFEHKLVTALIVSVAHLGITTGKGPEIVVECLYVMIRMTGDPMAARMLQYSELAEKIWTPIVKYATPENKDHAWDQVYLMCIQLTTKLLQTQSYYFLEDCLGFWGLHGVFIVHKLWSLSEMTKNCVMNNPEHNFLMMKNLLTFNVFVLDAVSAMVPYYDEWKIQQGGDHIRVMEGVFTALQTSVNLLNQPSYLQVLISFSKSLPPHLELRLTPQLFELQAKLWDVIYLGCHIFWKLRHQSEEFVQSDVMLGTVNQVAQACLKGLTKGERRTHSSGSGPQPPAGKVTVVLERALCLFHYHAAIALDDAKLSVKQQQNFKREIASDIGTICDGIRRTGGPKNEFLLGMCNCLEETFKPDILKTEAELEADKGKENNASKLRTIFLRLSPFPEKVCKWKKLSTLEKIVESDNLFRAPEKKHYYPPYEVYGGFDIYKCIQCKEDD